MNSTGSAVRENEAYMQGLEATVNKFKSAWEALSNSVANSDLVKLIINLGTGVLKGLNSDLGVTVTQIGLLTGTLTGVISLGSKFIANLLPGVTSVTTAMAGLSAAALPVAAAIAGITTAVIAGASAWKNYHDTVYDASDALEHSLNSVNETFEETKKTTNSTADVARKYAARLEELNQETDKGREVTQEYKHVVDMLNELIPNLNLSIDSVTGKVKQQTTEIYANIEAWRKSAVEQAVQEQKSGILKAQAEAQIALTSKKLQKTDIEAQLKAAQERLNANLSYREQAGEGNIRPSSPYYDKDKWGMMEVDRALQKEQLDLETKISGYEDQIELLKKSIAVTQKSVDESDEQLKLLEKVWQEMGYSAEEASKIVAKQKAGKAWALELGGGKAPGVAQAQEEPSYKFNYSDWLDKQQHALAMGEIQEADYYASLEFMLNKWTDESVISTKERWRAEEAIYKYKKELSEQEQKDYENKLKAQQTASKTYTKSSYDDAQAQTTAYKQAFTDWLDEKEYLLNTDQITEQEYYDALKAKNEEYYGGKSEYLSEYRKYAEIVYKWEKKQNDEIAKAAKQAHEDEFDSWLAKMEHALAMGEISEEDYYERLKEMSDEYFKGDEEYLEKYWKYEEQYYSWKQKQIETAAEAEKKAQEEALERQKEKLKLQQQELQTEQDNLNAVISYAQKYSQKQIDDIDERINKLKDEANAIKDNYQDQIDKLKETNEALDDQIEKQKLLEALAKAQQTKKYVFKDGRFQYVDDVDAITSAQEALDNYNRQQSLNERVALLEKQRDAELASNEAAQAALEQQKQRWQDYKDGWANLTDEYEYNQNELLALEQYGIDFEKATWDERIANLNDFKERYAQNVKDLEKLAARLNSLETSSSPSSTIQTATKVDPDQAILDEMKANSQAWWFASTDKEREAIHKRNVELNEMLSKKGTYDSSSGKWSHYAKGTTSARGGLSLVGEKGAELRVLNKGDGVVPAHMTENLMDWGTQKPNDFVNKMLNKGKEILSNVINVGNVSLPNVQNAKEFVSELKNLAYQAAYSRT